MIDCLETGGSLTAIPGLSYNGPFSFAPGDTQWMMTALVPADSIDYKQSVTTLREYARRLHNMTYEEMTAPSVSQAIEPNEKTSGLPEKPALEQNYPNPFNPSTTIRYAMPHRSHVTLSVYNPLGQKVAELVNGDTDPGSHTVQFDASALASGVHYYRLQTGSFVQTRKLLLVR